MLLRFIRALGLLLCVATAVGCDGEDAAPRYATLVRFEGPPPAQDAATVRLLVMDLEGADATGWVSPAGTRSPYEQLRALGLAMQRYKADTVVVRGLPSAAEVGGAASSAELLAASAELYYRAERQEPGSLCAGPDWDSRWWPRRCPRATMVASLRPVAWAGDEVTLGSGAAAVAVGLKAGAGLGITLQAGSEVVVAGDRWRILRQAEDRFEGLLLRPARFYELQRVAPAPGRQ